MSRSYGPIGPPASGPFRATQWKTRSRVVAGCGCRAARHLAGQAESLVDELPIRPPRLGGVTWSARLVDGHALRTPTERLRATKLRAVTGSSHRLERLIDIGRGLVTELDREEVLNRILEAARELTGARYAAVGVLGDDRRELDRFLTSGIDEATHEAIGDLPHGRGVLGVLIRDPRPLRLEDVGAHPDSYGFPLAHPPMRSFLGVPILVRGEAWGNIYLAEKAGGEQFTEVDESSLVVLADWAAIAIDNARAYSGERERRERLERSNLALRATDEIARALGGETDLDRILELIAKRGRALVSARAMLIALIDGDEAYVAAAAGTVPHAVADARFPLTATLASEVIRTGRPRRLTGDLGGLRSPVAELMEANHGLVVPLVFRGGVLGIMAAFDRLEDGPDFTDDDERLIGAFAASAATAVATGQHVAAEGVRRALHASEQERGRWAREVHDDTLQDLAALRLVVGSAQRAGDLAEVREMLADVREGLGNAIDNLRALITDLRPAALDELGTVAALEALGQRISRRVEISVVLHADLDYERGREPTRHTPELEAAVYRLAQEALTNVVKHAGAKQVEVTLVEHGAAVELVVSDDGRGFDEAAITPGFGLVGMRERAELAGGTLRVETAPGKGTVVTARLPVQRRSTVEPRPRLSSAAN
jgi:signal transduction histidine kinase